MLYAVSTKALRLKVNEGVRHTGIKGCTGCIIQLPGRHYFTENQIRKALCLR